MTTAWTPDEMAGEQTRRTSNRDKALAALQQAGEHGLTNMELMTIAGTRAGGRVDELRRMGHRIDCDRIDGGLYRYTLRSGPQPGSPGYLSSLPAVNEATSATWVPAVRDGLLF